MGEFQLRNFTMKFFALLCVIGLAQAKNRYDGHKIIDVSTDTEEQLAQLNKIRHNTVLNLDFWNEPTVGGKAKVHVNPENEALFVSLLNSFELENEVVESDIQKHLDKEDEDNELSVPLWGKNLHHLLENSQLMKKS